MLRDTQRSKVYKAEQKADWSEHAAEKITLPDITLWVNKITQSRWWWSRFPSASSSIAVKDGRGRRRAGGAMHYITLPKWSRTRWIVLHELAHSALAPLRSQIAAHGREYCRAYLVLVRRWLGEDDYLALKQSFREFRVRTRGSDRDAAERRLLKREQTKMAARKPL